MQIAKVDNCEANDGSKSQSFFCDWTYTKNLNTCGPFLKLVFFYF